MAHLGTKLKASQVKTKIPTWAWKVNGDGAIPVGGLTIVTGKGGDGKSTLCRGLASRITTGSLTGCWQGTPHNFVYIAAEESVEHAVTPSLRVNGADMERVNFLSKKDQLYDFDPARDMPALIELCKAGEGKAVFVDPITNFFGGKDLHKASEVREALRPWSQLAEEIDGAVIAIAHQNKGAGGDVVSGVGGSSAITEVARSVLGTAYDKETGQRVLSQAKNNLRKFMPTYNFDLVEERFTADDGNTGTAMVFALGSRSEFIADEIQQRNKFHSSGEKETAKGWLRDYLKENGATLKKEILRVANGKFSESAIEKASRDLNLEKSYDNRKVMWSLP